MGNGLGSFSTATNFTVGIAPTSIISADFNGDSKMDLITANANSNNVSVLLNNIPIVSATVIGATITANQNAAAYQWINCNGNLPISGETNQSFVTTSNGHQSWFEWSVHRIEDCLLVSKKTRVLDLVKKPCRLRWATDSPRLFV